MIWISDGIFKFILEYIFSNHRQAMDRYRRVWKIMSLFQYTVHIAFLLVHVRELPFEEKCTEPKHFLVVYQRMFVVWLYVFRNVLVFLFGHSNRQKSVPNTNLLVVWVYILFSNSTATVLYLIMSL